MSPGREETSFRLFVATAFFAPVAFGTVETWSMLIMEAGMLSALVLYLSNQQAKDAPGLLVTPGIRPLGALLGIMLLQIIPLPPLFVKAVSPAAAAFYRGAVWAVDPGAWVTFSLAPKQTLSELLRFSSYAAAYVLTVQLLSHAGRFRKAVQLFACFASSLAFFAIVQHLATNGRIFWFRAVTEGGMSFGPYVNRNHFAGFMSMLFPLVLALFLSANPVVRQGSLRSRIAELLDHPLVRLRILLGFGAVLIALSVFLCNSRIGILSLLVSLVLILVLPGRQLLDRRKKILLALIAVTFLYAAGWFGWDTVFQRFQTIRSASGDIAEARLGMWRDTLRIISDFVATGSGAGSFMPVYPAYQTLRTHLVVDHAHNDYLEMLATLGVPGTALVAWFVIAVLFSTVKAFRERKDPYARYLSSGALAAAAAFFLLSLTDFNLFIGANGLCAFITFGICVSVSHTRFQGGEGTALQRTGTLPGKALGAAAGAALALAIIFNAGQLFSDVLRSDALRLLQRDAASGNQAAACKAVRRASVLDPLEPANHELLGRIASLLRENETALRHYHHAVRLAPSVAGYLQSYGRALEESGEAGQAREVFAASVRAAPFEPVILLHHGSFLLRHGQKAEAARLFGAVLQREPKRIRSYIPYFVLEGLSDEEIHRMVPREAGSLMLFAEYLEAIGSLDRAVAAYREALQLLKDRPPESSGVYGQAAQFAARRERFREAVEIMLLAEGRFPKESSLALAAGGYCEKLGLSDEAAVAYRRVLAINPEDKSAGERLRVLSGR